MAFAVEIPVRFRDVDGMRHVNNAVYFTYMEQARTEYYRHLTGATSLDELSIILAHASCDFKAPIGIGETVVATVWLTKIGDSSFVLKYELRGKSGGTLFATGESVQVTYDYRAGKSIAIPPRLRLKLEQELANPFRIPESRNR